MKTTGYIVHLFRKIEFATEPEAVRQASLKNIFLECFFFWGIWVSITPLFDLLESQPEYPAEFHYGVGIAAILALILTVKAHLGTGRN